MSLKPICYKCQRFYRPKLNGVTFLEGMPADGSRLPPPGTSHPELWKPYKLWRGDLWECKGCNHEIIVGFGLHPISEHYMPDFEQWVKKLKITYQVNDC